MGNCNRSNMGQRECGERYDMSSCQDFALAMAYVPWQHFEHVYEPGERSGIWNNFSGIK